VTTAATTLEALRHTVGRGEHMPHLQAIVAGRVGPVTFAEIAEALATAGASEQPAGVDRAEVRLLCARLTGENVEHPVARPITGDLIRIDLSHFMCARLR
jgi:hypothetical protein